MNVLIGLALAGIVVCIAIYPPAAWAVVVTVLIVVGFSGKTTHG